MITRVSFERAVDDKCWAISWHFSKGWINFWLYLYWFDFHFHAHAKDWMLKTDEIITVGDRKYRTYKKNPKYENKKDYIFLFPP